MMKIIENKTFEKERALYNINDAEIKNCIFKGEEDGESVLKEARNIIVSNSLFALRYPLWHVIGLTLRETTIELTARAPIWYSKNVEIYNSNIDTVKALRESKNIKILNSHIDSEEFAWKCSNIKVFNSYINGEYAFLDSKKVYLRNINFNGKYSFQYIKDLKIENSHLTAKDAFWHSSNIYIKDSYIEGEYLGWFSKNITLENCIIKGTQPFCYVQNLTLINCEMIDADLAFEYSDVNATIKGKIKSIKNPKSGLIVVDEVEEIIFDEAIMECVGKIEIRK